MNNKGFAITGIIYTLFILFLMILLTVLTNLSSYQKLMVNSTRTLEDSFEGEEINSNINTDKFYEIKKYGYAKYLGKYVFKTDNNNDGNINSDDDLECSVYLKKDTFFIGYDTTKKFSENIAKLSPNECNDYDFDMELVRVYSFEVINQYEEN